MNKTSLRPFLFTTMAIRFGILILMLLTGLLFGYALSCNPVAASAPYEAVRSDFYVSSILTSTTTIPPTNPAATTPTIAPTATPVLSTPSPTPLFAGGSRSTSNEGGLPLFPILIGAMFTMLVLAVALPFIRSRFKKK
jgi:hypothetical protein